LDCQIDPGDTRHRNIRYDQIGRLKASGTCSGEVKNLAEKPFIFNMAARLDAMTGSSSTTKMRGPGEGLFLYFSVR
jgi:hypothetical protein